MTWMVSVAVVGACGVVASIEVRSSILLTEDGGLAGPSFDGRKGLMVDTD